MKYNPKKIITIIIFVLILIFTIVLLFSSPSEDKDLESIPRFSLQTLFDGSFIKDVENYFSVQFPFKNNFVSLRTRIDRMLGRNDINGIFISRDGYLIENYQKPMNSDVIINRLNDFFKDLNHVNMNLMLVPTSITINENLLPRNAPIYNQKAEMGYIKDRIHFDVVRTYDILKRANNLHQIFYKLDQHWTTHAAYFAYTEFARINKFEHYEMSAFDIRKVTDNFRGSLFSRSGVNRGISDSIFIFEKANDNFKVEYVFDEHITNSFYEKKWLDEPDKYRMFLDDDHPLIVITNNNIDTNTELLVIKDSFANSIIPFLARHYKRVHVIDPRLYNLKISDYIRKNDIKDLLILFNMNNVDTNASIFSIN